MPIGPYMIQAGPISNACIDYLIPLTVRHQIKRRLNNVSQPLRSIARIRKPEACMVWSLCYVIK